MNKAIIIIIAVLGIAAGVGLWYWYTLQNSGVDNVVNAPAPAPALENQPTQQNLESDNISAIKSELDEANVSDVEQELKTLDADINSL